MSGKISVNVERVLVAAAEDPQFLKELLSDDRMEAIERRGIKLRSNEYYLLDAIDDSVLLESVQHLDVSRKNRERRAFLKIVAAGATLATGAETLKGCGDDDEPILSAGIKPDLPGRPKDLGATDRGTDAKKEAGASDLVKIPDQGSWLDGKLSNGIRPGG